MRFHYEIRYYAILALLAITQTITKNHWIPLAAEVRVKRQLLVFLSQ